MTFGEPLYLLLIVFPGLALFFAWKKTKDRSLSFRALTREIVHIRWMSLVLLVLGTISIVVAIAQPRWGVSEVPVSEEGNQLIVVLDLSRSMAVDDVEPDRLTSAKDSIIQVLSNFIGGRVALVIFSGDAILRFPLTRDFDAAANVVSSLTTGSILLEKGTDTASGLELAHRIVDPLSDSKQLVILISDGEDFGDQTLQTASLFRREGVQFLVAGVGTTAGVTVRAYDRFTGRPYYLMRSDGSPVVSKLNEERLKDIARSAGGSYIGNDLSLLPPIVNSSIESISAKSHSPNFIKRPFNRFQVFTFIALVLFGVATILESRRVIARPFLWLGLLVCSVVIFVSCSSHAWTLNDRAIRAWDMGDLDRAATLLFEAHSLEPENAKISLNLSSVLFLSGRYEESIDFAQRTLDSGTEDLIVLAYQNLARSRFELGDLLASLALFKQSLLLDPDDKKTRLDYEIVYTILYGSENQMSEGEMQDNKDAGDERKGNQPQDHETKKEGTDTDKNISTLEVSDLSRADIQQLLEDMDVQIEKIRATFGEKLTAEEAYALLKLIEERARLAGLRTLVGLETNSEAR